MSVNVFSEKTPKNFSCEICGFISFKYSDYSRHILTAKHIKNAKNQCLSIKNAEKAQPIFCCEKCDYNTSNKFDFDKHLSTDKHIVNVLAEKPKKSAKYVCQACNKEYTLYNSYYKHKLRCKDTEPKTELINEFRQHEIEKPAITIDFVLDLMKQNKDLQNCLMESHNKIVELSQNHSITNNTTNNTTNQQFNLQVFLNETCKDAMNITEFVNSLQLTTQDFENTGKLGFIEGITQIILNRLNNVDTTKRPMHCTDAKRETLYIKDDNVWEKEDDKKTKFKKVVNQIANKNLQQLNRWKEEHPDCINLDTQDNIDFRKYYKVALGGASNEEDEKFFEKIKRNVLKEIVVNKST
jgi:hypothetical protein